MAVLNIYDKFGEKLEEHFVNSSLKEWIINNVPSYRESIFPPYSAKLNGNNWPHINHDSYLVDSDIIDLTIEPKDPVSASTLYVILAVASAAYAYYVVSNIPKNYQKTTENGQSIYSPNTRVNTPKANGIIKEIAGRMPITYPDLLASPRRKYINHEEFIYLSLGITRGYMFLQESNFYISETPIVNYANDFTLNVFEPGDDISSSEAHENWYENLEILNLRLITTSTPKDGVWTVDYSGDQITSYLDGGAEAFPFIVGERFEIIGGSNPGYYEVTALSGASSETATVIGLQRANGDTGILEVYTQIILVTTVERNRNVSRGVRQNIFTSTGSPTLNSATGESISDWYGVNGGVNWEGPFRVAPDGQTCRYLEIDVNFPGGLVEVNNDGDPTNATVDIAIEYREVGTGVWTTVSGTSYTDATFDERGYTVEVDMGSDIEAEIRVRRITKDSDDINLQDNVFIKRVKAKLETPASYDDITTVGLVLRGTNALAATSENKINIRGATRKLPTLQQIQDACNGTPFDISSASTQTVDYYNITSVSFISDTNVVNDILPELSGNRFSVDFDSTGLEMLVYDNGVLRFYTLGTAYRPDLGYTYNGYTSEGAASVYGVKAMFWGSTSDVLILKKQSDPSPNYFVTHVNFSTALDPTTASSVDSYTFSGIADVRSFYAREDQDRLWIVQGDDQTVHEYDLSTTGDITTLTANTTLDISSQLGDNTSDSSLDAESLWLDDYSGGVPTKMWVMDAGGVVHYWTVGASISSVTYVGSTSFAGNSYLDLRMASEYAIFYSTAGDSSVAVYSLDTLADSAATRSLVRFAANAIYQDVGVDTLNLIDWDEMATLDTLLNSRTDYFDGEFVDETTLWEALKIIFSPGYTEPTVKEGKLFPVRIASNSDYDHLYTADVMLGDGLVESASLYIGTESDGVDVEYLSEDTQQVEVVECRLTGDLGIRATRINAVGITNRTKAWRYGMRERRRERLKPSRYSFSTEYDALNSNYGSYDAVASDMLSGQCGEVVSVSGSDITLDFEPVISGTTYAAFRTPEGGYSGLYTIVAGGSANEITLSSPSSLDFTPITDGSGDPSYVSIGSSSEVLQRIIVRSIEPNGEEVGLVGEEYIEALFDSDDASPP